MQDSLAWAPSILFSPARLGQRQSRLDNPDSAPPSLEARVSRGLGADKQKEPGGTQRGMEAWAGSLPLGISVSRRSNVTGDHSSLLGQICP